MITYVVAFAFVAYLVLTLTGHWLCRHEDATSGIDTETDTDTYHFHPMGPVHQRREMLRRHLAIICAQCGQVEEVEAFTTETVGDWGDKVLCSRCKEAKRG